MKDTSVAGRYAQALFIVTEKRAETDRALVDLLAVATMVTAGSSVGAKLASPLVLLSDKRKVVRAALDGKALPAVAVFLDLLLRKKRLGEFAEIARQFEALVEKKQGIRRVQVSSAVALLPAELDRLQRAIEQRLGGTVRLTTTLDPDLIGGVVVRVGDRLFDGSIENQLERVSRELYDVSV